MPTDEEKREARRRRILDNSEKRLNRILGVDQPGGGRREPGLEDGGFRRSALAAQQPPADDKPTEPTEPSGENNNVAECPKSPTSDVSADDTLNADASKPYFFLRPRLLAALLIGVLSCLVPGWLPAGWSAPSNLLVVWLIYEANLTLWNSVLARNASTKPRRFPSHGHVVDLMLSFGCNERLVFFGGKAAEKLTDVLNDLALMFLSFLLTNAFASSPAAEPHLVQP